MLQCLAAEKVKFLLVGAYAMAAHGYPRATMDIDLWVMPTRGNAKAVMKALRKFGAPLHGLTTADLLKDDTIFQIGVAPRRIDIITGASGLLFEKTFKKSIEVDIDKIKVRIPSVADLIRNKKSSGRTKDLADVEALVAIKDSKSSRGK